MGGELASGSTLSTVPLAKLITRIEAGRSPLAEGRAAAPGQWGVLKVSAVRHGRFDPDENKAISDPVLVRPEFEVRHGDLLLSRANTEDLVGLACVVRNPRPRLMLSDKTLRLHVDESLATADFIELVLGSREIRSRMQVAATGTSGSMKNLSQGQIRRLPVPHLPITEQRCIVDAISAVDRNIEALERQFAKMSEVRLAVIQHELNRIDEVERLPLAAVTEPIVAGVTLGPHRAPRNRPAPYLRVANVHSGRIDMSDLQYVETQNGDRPRYEVRSGDGLVVEGHANPEQIGRCAIVGGRESGVLYQNHLFRLRFRQVNPGFAGLWLNSPAVRSYWRSRCATSSGLFTINSRQLGEVPFPAVSVDQQDRILTAVTKVDRNLEALGLRVAKLRTIRQALAEDLLTGRVRVTDL